jgi:hypothetical protein
MKNGYVFVRHHLEPYETTSPRACAAACRLASSKIAASENAASDPVSADFAAKVKSPAIDTAPAPMGRM